MNWPNQFQNDNSINHEPFMNDWGKYSCFTRRHKIPTKVCIVKNIFQEVILGIIWKPWRWIFFIIFKTFYTNLPKYTKDKFIYLQLLICTQSSYFNGYFSLQGVCQWRLATILMIRFNKMLISAESCFSMIVASLNFFLILFETILNQCF